MVRLPARAQPADGHEGTGVREVRVLMGRIEMLLDDDADWSRVRDRVSDVFGIANFARARAAPLDVDAIAREILEDLGDREARHVSRVARVAPTSDSR